MLGWPKVHSGFFSKMLLKNSNKLFGQPSIYSRNGASIGRCLCGVIHWLELGDWLETLGGKDGRGREKEQHTHIFIIYTLNTHIYMCIYIYIYICKYIIHSQELKLYFVQETALEAEGANLVPFFFWPRHADCRILVPWAKINGSRSQQWKHWVLTSRPAGNWLFCSINSQCIGVDRE